MSVFFDNAITDNGRQLWAEIQAGGVFTPTKIVMGKGYMPSGKTTRTMTAVAETVKELSLNKKAALTSGDFVFGAMFSNQEITESFYFRELALYAKVVREDETETSEVLYSYGNAGDNAELIPAYSVGTAVERQIDIISYIGNDATVNLTVEGGVYVLQSTYNAKMALLDAEDAKKSETDKTILNSGTILAWANSCNVDTSKFILTDTHTPSDIPMKTSGFLEVLVQGTYKTVRFTPFGFKDGVKYSRDITNGAWNFGWGTDMSSGGVTVYLDATNGDDSNAGIDATTPMKTIAAAVAKYKGARTLRVALSPGTYNEAQQIAIQEFQRFGLYRNGTGTATVNGAFHITSGFARISDVNINSSALNTAAIDAVGAGVVLDNCTITAKATQNNSSFYEANAYLNNCNFVNGNYSILAWGGKVGVESGTITGSNVGLYSNSAVITHGGLSNGATTAEVTYHGGQIMQ